MESVIIGQETDIGNGNTFWLAAHVALHTHVGNYNFFTIFAAIAGNIVIRDFCIFGANSKMNEFQAAMGLCNLRHVDDEILKRKAVAERYRERLADVPGIRLVAEQPGVRQNYAYFPALFEAAVFGRSRDEIYEELKT